jgi:hypothetical protein
VCKTVKLFPFCHIMLLNILVCALVIKTEIVGSHFSDLQIMLFIFTLLEISCVAISEPLLSRLFAHKMITICSTDDEIK